LGEDWYVCTWAPYYYRVPSSSSVLDVAEAFVDVGKSTEIVAGLFAYTLWNWLEVRHLWVSEALRHQGLGRQLMLAAEREARLRGCDHAHVDTFTFQAVPFYERLGYSVFGRLENYPAGHTRVFLVKRDLPK
jgi:GNAT superfamily N-acetyltransferase